MKSTARYDISASFREPVRRSVRIIARVDEFSAHQLDYSVRKRFEKWLGKVRKRNVIAGSCLPEAENRLRDLLRIVARYSHGYRLEL